MDSRSEPGLVTQESSETTASAPRKISGHSVTTGGSPPKSLSPKEDSDTSGGPAPPCNDQLSDELPQAKAECKSKPARRPYDCNICFDDATDPVVTRCGHLVSTLSTEVGSNSLRQYCWPCLHGWLERGILECPVCKAGVTQASVIPIYGQGCEGSDPR